ncbi:choice-of-anchor P family protein [Streptomyces chiangmaiensis]|uniref:Choice-of-anchor P family protein n=1 Tax=Streptomyces chiangmaiensis TaxID=766497 RepID=A0ABU7FHM2_9ACTN|nr:choice-of-anchor P family protein [Streptomyces chiangmaiensis]MED7823486.1 choice-of-anchor P family protein [Streptomyces chiangmaiensis]
MRVTTSPTGSATCTVTLVDQPVTDSATVPLRASFAGDAGHLASDTSAQPLKVAGIPVTVSGDPNTEIPLVGGGRLIVNRQLSSTGADAGIEVNGVRLVPPADGGEAVLAPTDSAMRNCGE